VTSHFPLISYDVQTTSVRTELCSSKEQGRGMRSHLDANPISLLLGSSIRLAVVEIHLDAIIRYQNLSAYRTISPWGKQEEERRHAGLTRA
jgi:hypothetical protein